MIDINLYSYDKKPFDVNDKFVINPLDDNGVKKYLYNKESHAHTYLDQINPVKMRQVYEEKQKLDEYMESVLQKRETERNLKYGLSSTNNMQKKESIKNSNEDNFHNNLNNERTEDVYDSSKVMHNVGKNQAKTYTQKFYPHYKKIEAKPLDEKLACFGNTNFGKLYNPKYSYQKLHKKSHKTRYSVNEDEIQNLNNHHTNSRSLRKTGFESYDVPRVSNKTTKNPVEVEQFNKKCFKSFSNFFNSGSNDFEGYLKDYNKKLEINLLNQTGEAFLKASNLPKINLILNQPELIIKKTGIGNSKFMGSKYNPHNFGLANFKNMTKRNNNGALFLN